MLASFHKIIRVFLIIIPIFVLGWLVAKEIVPSGKLEAAYDMQRETPFISKLYPKDRISEAQEDVDGNFYRIFLSEPVYFDLKPNDSFEKVAITIQYKNSGPESVKFGSLRNKEIWAFDWRNLPSTGEGWQSKTEFFDVAEIIPEDDKYRFGFSAAGIQPGFFSVSDIKVLFVRQELDEKGIVNKILEGIIWRFNRLF